MVGLHLIVRFTCTCLKLILSLIYTYINFRSMILICLLNLQQQLEFMPLQLNMWKLLNLMLKLVTWIKDLLVCCHHWYYAIQVSCFNSIYFTNMLSGSLNFSFSRLEEPYKLKLVVESACPLLTLGHHEFVIQIQLSR